MTKSERIKFSHDFIAMIQAFHTIKEAKQASWQADRARAKSLIGKIVELQKEDLNVLKARLEGVNKVSRKILWRDAKIQSLKLKYGIEAEIPSVELPHFEGEL